mgnify:CR=1 FL=1
MGQPGSRILRWNSGLVRFCKLNSLCGKEAWAHNPLPQFCADPLPPGIKIDKSYKNFWKGNKFVFNLVCQTLFLVKYSLRTLTIHIWHIMFAGFLSRTKYSLKWIIIWIKLKWYFGKEEVCLHYIYCHIDILKYFNFCNELYI